MKCKLVKHIAPTRPLITSLTTIKHDLFEGTQQIHYSNIFFNAITVPLECQRARLRICPLIRTHANALRTRTRSLHMYTGTGCLWGGEIIILTVLWHMDGVSIFGN